MVTFPRTQSASAARYYARERRREMSGAPFNLNQTQSYAIGDTIEAASFPDTDRPVSIWTRVRTLGTGAPTGIVFCVGNATTATALYYTAGLLVLRTGSLAAANKVLITFAGDFNTDREYDLSCAIIPGSGEVRFWGFGGARISATAATGGSLSNGWAAATDGIYAGAAPVGLPADVIETGAPANFVVTSALRVYDGQRPRIFKP